MPSQRSATEEHEVSFSFYRFCGKRIFDVTAGLILFLILLPFLGILAWFVRHRLGKPVLFRQERPGVGGRLFYIVKFRTMTNAIDEAGNLLPDSMRLPSFGRFLRSCSLDELPELLNVIRGEMSFVGPRPLRTEYLKRYTTEQARRHEVRPGITGLAQVNGRNAISWEEKFYLDVWYVDNISFWLDLKILLLTAWKVFRREGISAEGEATMPEFMGNSSEKRG